MSDTGAKTASEESADELRRALARETRVAAALREVGVALGTTLDLDDLLELILGRLTELLEADRSTLYLVDEGSGDLVSRVVVGSKVRSIRVKIGHGIAGAVAQSGKPLRVSEAYKDPRFEPEWDLLTGYRTTCMLAAPLKNHLGRTIGVIQVLNKSEGVFSDEDEAILTTLSTQAAVAIDNSRLFLTLVQKNRQLLDTKDKLERKVRDLELLFELEQATSRATSTDVLVSAALSTAARACEARGAALLLATVETGDLVQYIYDDDASTELSRFGVKDEGLLGVAMHQEDMLNVRRVRKDPRWSPGMEGNIPFSADSMLAYHLDGEEGSVGAIALLGKRGARPFGAADEDLLRLVSANLSTALRLFSVNAERERTARLTSIGRLLSQVIHDFRTPMTVISGHAQLMALADDPKVRQEHLQKVLRQFDLLTSMQKEVLEFARGERKIFVRRVFLHKFFSEIRQNLAHEVDGRAIELELDIDTKLVARFDENRIARAVQNLARNAVEAMSETGGVLTIAAQMVQDELLISVADTGPGVPPEIQHKLFQSFVTAGKEHGTGLGLAIVRKIVEEHGGTVACIALDRGTRFEMRLPQSSSPISQRSGRSVPPPPPPNGQPRP